MESTTVDKRTQAPHLPSAQGHRASITPIRTVDPRGFNYRSNECPPAVMVSTRCA